MVKLLGISASLRVASTNTMLVREAARLFGDCDFALADLELPLYNQDVEDQGLPAPVSRLCAQIAAADAIVISTTEYNHGPSGVLKNALDWVSRPRPAPMVGKPVAVLSAAAGITGGARATSMLYLMLIPFKARLIFDPAVMLGASASKFDAQGRLTDDGIAGTLSEKMQELRAALAC